MHRLNVAAGTIPTSRGSVGSSSRFPASMDSLNVYLPIAEKMSSNKNIPPLHQDAETALEAASVLLFHPEKENRGTFLDNLRACGVKNHTLTDKPQDAVNLLMTKHYDVILVCYMGHLDTIEQFISELRSLDTIAGIPLLAITPDGSSKNILRIMSREVDRVLIMPLSRKVMRDALRNFLWADPADTTTSSLQDASRYCQAGEWDQAEVEYLDILKRNPAQVEALMGVAAVLLRRKQNTRAVEYLKEAMKSAKQISDVVEQTRLLAMIYATLGGHFATLGSLEQAVKHYKAALKLNPFCSDVLPKLIPMMAKTGSLDDILAYIDGLVVNYPDYSVFREQLSAALSELLSTYAILNMDDNIAKLHAYLASLKHSDANLHLITVNYWLENGRHTAVKNLLESVLARVKDSDLMVCLADLYRNDTSQKSGYEKNKTKSPVDKNYLQEHPPEYWLKQAHALYKNALLLDPFDLSIWLKLLRCHLAMRELDSAEQLLERLFANLTIGQEGHVQVCVALLDEKAYTLARQQVESGLKKYPLVSHFHWLAAQVYNAEGHHYDAIAALKTGLREKPDDIECLTELGKSYGLIKNWSQAVEVYERALKLSPDDAALHNSLQSALQSKYKSA